MNPEQAMSLADVALTGAVLLGLLLAAAWYVTRPGADGRLRAEKQGRASSALRRH